MYCIFHDVCFIATTFSLSALRLMNETQVSTGCNLDFLFQRLDIF